MDVDFLRSIERLIDPVVRERFNCRGLVVEVADPRIEVDSRRSAELRMAAGSHVMFIMSMVAGGLICVSMAFSTASRRVAAFILSAGSTRRVLSSKSQTLHVFHTLDACHCR